MKKSIKAALMSGLIFPGTGQIHLKRFRRGIVIMLLVLSGISAIVWMATVRALAVLENIERQLNQSDMVAMSNHSLLSSSGHESTYYNILVLFIVCCWLFSIIDAYRIGEKEDLSAQTNRVR